MERITLERTGQRPLVFTGELIKTESTRRHNSSRWTDMSIYRTAGGKYVASMYHATCWQGEHDTCTAQVFATIEDMCRWFTGETGSEYGAGGPALSALLKDFPEEVE